MRALGWLITRAFRVVNNVRFLGSLIKRAFRVINNARFRVVNNARS